MRTLYSAILLLGITPGLSGCGFGGEESAPAPTATVRIAVATQRDFEDRVTVYGSVELAADQSQALSVQTESQIVELFVVQGAAVHQGDPLLRLVASANSRLDAEKADRDAAAAEAEAARIARLHAQGLATNAELQAARNAAATAVALRDSLNSRVGHEAGITLRAPRAGIVVSMTAQPGDIIAPGGIAVRIADPSRWQVRLGVEPDQVERVKAGQSVALSGLSGSANTAGVIKYLDQRIDAQSRLATAIAIGHEPLSLPPGAGVRGEITLATHLHGIAVPRAAVLYEDEKPYVFVAVKTKAERRAVAIGFQDDAGIEIVKGVAPGESVVVLGNDELTDGMPIRLESGTAEQPAP